MSSSQLSGMSLLFFSSSSTLLLTHKFSGMPHKPFVGEEVLEVKTESPSPHGCVLRDVPGPPLGAVQISMGPSPDGSSGNGASSHLGSPAKGL